ncbi:MAG: MFS transporter [Candidatus Hydrogenedentes bacterium]|nr:MFS transporter [Candidatus Hydrogenedentota bacterium]
MVSVALGAGLLPVYLTTFAAEFGGLGESELGRLPGALFAGFVVGILLTGPLADRLGSKLFLLGGLGMSVAGLVAGSLAPAFNGLLAAAAMLGLGSGVVDALMSPIVAAVQVERRAAALNWVHAFYSIGVVGIVVIATGSMALGVSWRTTMLVLSLLPVACLVGFVGVELPPLVHPGQQRQRLRVLFRWPRFYLAGLIIFLAGATEEGISQWLPAYAELSLGYGKATAGMALSGFALAHGLGRVLGSSRWNMMSPYRLLVVAAGFSGLCFLLGAWAPAPGVGLIACMLCGLGCSVLWPTNLAITADRIPHGGASLFGIMAGLGNLGCAVAPWAAGILGERTSLRTALFVGTASPLLIVVLALVILRWDRAAELRIRNEK